MTKRWMVGPHVGGNFASLYSYEQKYSPMDVTTWVVQTPDQKLTSTDTRVQCLDSGMLGIEYFAVTNSILTSRVYMC